MRLRQARYEAGMRRSPGCPARHHRGGWQTNFGNCIPSVKLAMADRVLPHWPRRMKLHLAAAYVDESETKFLDGVKRGKWPGGTRDGGNVYWYIEDLDAHADRLKPGAVAIDGWGDYVRGQG